MHQQSIHQDAEIDERKTSFDIQISVFPHDVSPEMGGTLCVPGSHFRRVHESTVGIYHNIVGQVQTVCKSGTVVVWHHNIWHAGRANATDHDRYMFKLRLNPMVRQRRLFNTDDCESLDVRRILHENQPWHAQEGRRELYQRVSLWRQLSGNEDYELGGFYHERSDPAAERSYRRARM
jgi:ectoine hydroxylase-related dioxygenase (phytanoyl-CoA dioxygenase family)